MSQLLVRLIAIKLFIGFLLCVPILAQEPATSKAIEHFVVEKLSFEDVVIKLAKETSIPIGLEVAGIDDHQGRKIDRDVHHTTLGTELKQLMRMDPRYEWSVFGNAINIYPKEIETSVFTVRVGPITVSDIPPIQMIRELLRDPAVVRYLKANRITATTWVTGSMSIEKKSLTIDEGTLRENLTRVILSTGHLGWVAFYRMQENSKYLYFQVL